MRVVFVHGACVRDGAWWWHRTAALLAEAGMTSVAPALPSCGETGAPVDATGPGLADDAAAVRTVLRADDAPTIVVAHSYGGLVAAEAVAGIAAVRHLVLVSSYLPETGERLSGFGGDEPSPALAVDPGAGTFTVRPDALADTFLQDAHPELQVQARERIAEQSLAVLDAPVSTAGWKDVPTTYVVCVRDRGTPADAQRRFARRADRVVELDADHHPFVGRPGLVRDLLLDLARHR